MSRISNFFLLILVAALFPPAGWSRQGPSLDRVLERMAVAGLGLRTLAADVERDTVNFIVNKHDLSSGKVYFSADGDNSRVRMTLTRPAPQEVLVADGLARVFSPRTMQVQEVNLGERSDIAEYLVVGFGPANAELGQNFEIEFVGEETVDNVRAVVIDLTPKSAEALRMISKVRLWVDQERWIPVQQRLDQPSRNYQVIKFSNINVNARLSSDMFELDLPAGVQILR